MSLHARLARTDNKKRSANQPLVLDRRAIACGLLGSVVISPLSMRSNARIKPTRKAGSA